MAIHNRRRELIGEVSVSLRCHYDFYWMHSGAQGGCTLPNVRRLKYSAPTFV